MKTDRLFHRLFRVRPELALRLAGIDPPPSGYRQTAIEVKETALRIDGALIPPDPGRPTLFWEAQFQPDRDFYGRWFSSLFTCLHQQRIEHWRALAIFPSRSIDTGRTGAYRFLLERGPVRRVYLDEPDAWAELDTGPGAPAWDLGLIRLIAADPAEAPRLAGELTREPARMPEALPLREVLDLVETILVYKLPELSREEIRIMLHLPDVELQETRFYKEVFAEGEARGKVLGEARGKALGEARGKALGEARLAWRQLQRRLGPLPAAYEERIRSLPIDRIEALGEALLDFQSRDDLEAWFSANAG